MEKIVLTATDHSSLQVSERSDSTERRNQFKLLDLLPDECADASQVPVESPCLE